MEPTEAMIEAGADVIREHGGDMMHEVLAERVWRAMAQAAAEAEEAKAFGSVAP